MKISLRKDLIFFKRFNLLVESSIALTKSSLIFVTHFFLLVCSLVAVLPFPFFLFLFFSLFCIVSLIFLSSFSSFNLLPFYTFLSLPYFLQSFPLLSALFAILFFFFLSPTIIFFLSFLYSLLHFLIFFSLFFIYVFSSFSSKLSFNYNSCHLFSPASFILCQTFYVIAYILSFSFLENFGLLKFYIYKLLNC